MFQRKAICYPIPCLCMLQLTTQIRPGPLCKADFLIEFGLQIHGIWEKKLQSEDDNLQLCNGFHPLFGPCNGYPCYETKWPHLVILNKSSTIDKGPVCELLLINPFIMLYGVFDCLILNIIILLNIYRLVD